MKKYILLNPVVINSYNLSFLEKKLNNLGFSLVFSKEDQAKIVKNEYKALLQKEKGTILDQRCPLIVDYFKKSKLNVKFHNIEPILIHIAKEIAYREDLADGQKWIITPCTALKKYGNSLNLENTFFFTWDEFCNKYSLNLKGKKLDNSPIPFGFFSDIEKNVISVEEKDLKNISNVSIKKVRLIEGLYCHNGCHNGDGVKCIKK
ncbi:hypothetical protein [Sneathia sanguinegens]|uniref:hypothetical protein n=1 Tax=Sneathia sanguinegens TaxID=40543 RepID=UPI00288A55B4|nr:hypothetical protein [Sneathia sanguinegens]